jgi:hypothetical protein
MSICPLGFKFCEQKEKGVPWDAKFFDVTCSNYYYCRSWVRAWHLPLHRITQENIFKFAPVGHEYYLVEFLNFYGYPTEGMHARDWAAYFGRYGYAEAVPLQGRETHITTIMTIDRTD